eukprot:scaffold324778_cov149-Cyclotella_meneghiniana.AAC.3
MEVQVYLRLQYQTSFKAKVPTLKVHHRTQPPPNQSPSRSRESTITTPSISGNSHGLPQQSHKCHRTEYLSRPQQPYMSCNRKPPLHDNSNANSFIRVRHREHPRSQAHICNQ